MSERAHSSAPLMVSVSGCRGITGESLTPDVVARFAGAFAGWVREEQGGGGAGRPVIVAGRDGRRGGEAVQQQAMEALRDAGCDVIDLGVATTPTVGVMVLHYRADGGLVVTASHNPAEWNGLKPISRAGGAAAPSDAARIAERFRENRVAARAGTRGTVREEGSAAEVHAARVVEAIARLTDVSAIRGKRFRVALDSVNASGRIAGRMLLERLGCAVTHLNGDSSGVFPHPPEPVKEHLGELCTVAAREGAAAGFAQDPDADRLAIVDEQGRYIGEEYTLVLAAWSMLAMLPGERARGAVLCANLSTSRMIDDVAAKFGARVVRTPVGEANVVAGMRREGAVIGGEGNGGVIWPEVVPIRDSLGAMALVLALMARTGKRLRELVADVPAYSIEKRKIELSGGSGMVERALGAVKAMFARDELNTSDGVRADFTTPSGKGRAWVHVRASNTEPIMRLIAEAPTAEDARQVLERVQKEIGK